MCLDAGKTPVTFGLASYFEGSEGRHRKEDEAVCPEAAVDVSDAPEIGKRPVCPPDRPGSED